MLLTDPSYVMTVAVFAGNGRASQKALKNIPEHRAGGDRITARPE
ncbi:MAG: hypothetical protein ACNYPE_07065 [Candidatus Azotimanducaceae bacterium WSBS_2022_MAG_OTU7]